jgi:hypothetical protein
MTATGLHGSFGQHLLTPDVITAKRVELSDNTAATMETDANLLTVDFTAPTGKDVEWKVFF